MILSCLFKCVLFKGKFLWPGFGDNVRALEWLLRRLDGVDDIAEKTAIGYIPSEGALNLEGLKESVDTKQLFSLPKDFWLSEVGFKIKWLPID